MERRVRRRLAACSVLSSLLVVVVCSSALAHATLLEASPAAGTKLSAPPDEVRLRFDEPVDAEFDPLKVFDSDGKRVDRDDARIDPNDARVLLEGLKQLSKGSYKVEWRVTSVDGHVISGEYGFSVTGSGGQGSQDGAKNGNEPATRNGEGIFAVFPRTVVYGALSVGALALVGLLVVLVTKLARRRKA